MSLFLSKHRHTLRPHTLGSGLRPLEVVVGALKKAHNCAFIYLRKNRAVSSTAISVMG